MTVSSQINKSGPYLENGVTTEFEYEFKIADASHIKVVRATAGVETVLELTADYTVTGVGNAGGGNVVIGTPASGSTLTLILNVPFTQELDLENQGAYNAEDVEKALDLAVMRDQQIAEEISRAVKVPVSTDPTYLETLIAGVVALLDSVDAVVTVAGIAPQVVAVADMETEVSTVAGISAHVVTVSGIAADVTAVAGIAGAVVGLAAIEDEIIALDTIKTQIVAVAGITSNVTAVAGNATNINAVAGNATNINAVAGNAAAINAVAAIDDEIVTAAGDSAEIVSVAGNSANINTVASNITAIAAVDANIVNVNTVAVNASDINTVVTNLADIQAAVAAIPDLADKLNKDGSNVGDATAQTAFRAAIGAITSSDVSNLDASVVTSGTFDDARIPNLNASKITAGTLPVARGGTGQTTEAGMRGVYTGTSVNNVTFPIGTTVYISTGNVDRNAVVSLFLSGTNGFVTSSGTAVAGTWRARGLDAGGLAQRVA